MALGFRLLGIPVRVNLWFAIVAVFLWQSSGKQSWETLAIWVVVMFSGVLAHEFGHALAGKAFGMTPNIELHGMGGLTWWTGGKTLTPGRRIVVSFAGPLVGIAIGSVALAVAVVRAPADTSLEAYLLQSTWWVNLGWGVLNLIPMMPLDGGNILASFLEIFLPHRGTSIARIISLFLAVALIAVSAASGYAVSAILLGFLAWSNYRAYAAERAIAADLPLRAELAELHRAFDRNSADEVIARAGALLERAKTPLVRADLVQLLAWGSLLKGDANAARSMLERMPHGRPADPALLGSILFECGEVERAITYLESAFAGGKAPLVEERLFRALLERGQLARAVEILGSPRGRDASTQVLARVERAAYEASQFDHAARLSELLFDRDRNPVHAFNVACGLARFGESEKALRWLERAREVGFNDPELLDTDEDLSSVRSLPRWRAFRARFG
jgi:Zn-dependent protease